MVDIYPELIGSRFRVQGSASPLATEKPVKSKKKL
jgi:hypothetical protein